MKFTIIATGKLKESFFKEAQAEFVKRLSKGATLEILELGEYKISDNARPSEISAALVKEAAEVSKHLAPKAFIVALCVEGQAYTTDAFYEMIEKCEREKPHIIFLIGSSYGLDEKLKAQAHARISLSAMTLPHHLARIVLLEQIYRCVEIKKGGRYNK